MTVVDSWIYCLDENTKKSGKERENMKNVR
jgi:hypothetical protein